MLWLSHCVYEDLLCAATGTQSWNNPCFWQTRELCSYLLSVHRCSYRLAEGAEIPPKGPVIQPERSGLPTWHGDGEKWWKHNFRATVLGSSGPLPTKPTTSPQPLSSMQVPPTQRQFKQGTLCSFSHAGVVAMSATESLGPSPMLGIQWVLEQILNIWTNIKWTNKRFVSHALQSWPGIFASGCSVSLDKFLCQMKNIHVLISFWKRLCRMECLNT